MIDTNCSTDIAIVTSLLANSKQRYFIKRCKLTNNYTFLVQQFPFMFSFLARMKLIISI